MTIQFDAKYLAEKNIVRISFSDELNEPISLELDAGTFITPNSSLIENVGRLVLSSAKARLLAENGEIAGHLLPIDSSASSVAGKIDSLEKSVSQGIREIIAYRMVKIATSKDPPYELKDLPILINAALLFGNSDVAKIKRNWPGIRRYLSLLAKEEDNFKRDDLINKFQAALMK